MMTVEELEAMVLVETKALDDAGMLNHGERGYLLAVELALERVAKAYLQANLTTCPICSCVRCDALRREYKERLG